MCEDVLWESGENIFFLGYLRAVSRDPFMWDHCDKCNLSCVRVFAQCVWLSKIWTEALVLLWVDPVSSSGRQCQRGDERFRPPRTYECQYLFSFLALEENKRHRVCHLRWAAGVFGNTFQDVQLSKKVRYVFPAQPCFSSTGSQQAWWMISI